MAPVPALELQGLTKRYDDGFLALEDFDLVVPDGKFFGLLGPNGAGKTTLISAVCNLIRVTAGDVRVFGHDHDTMGARKLIGLAEQDVNLDRFLDVEETLVYHGGYYGMQRAHARNRAREMMDVFDLRAKAKVRAPKLSGGMRRRLLLARALMHEPRLVILDEPTAGVDFELRVELWAYIRRLHAQGTTILLTTHYLEEAEELCEDIALIRGGRLLARDSAEGLKEAFGVTSLADAYVRAMAGSEIHMGEKSQDLGGRVKESAGALTGDDSLKNEGKVDQASASVKEKVGGAADKVKDAVNPDRS